VNHATAPGKSLVFASGILFLVIGGLVAIGVLALLADSNIAQAIFTLLLDVSFWITIGILGIVHCGDLKWARRLRNWGIVGIILLTLSLLITGLNFINFVLFAAPIMFVAGAQRNISALNKISQFIQSGFLSLEHGEWDKAKDFFEQALLVSPENANAYIGKLCVELCLNREEKLLCYGPALAGYRNYQQAVQFADETYKATLELYLLTPAERLEREVQRLSELADKIEKARVDKSFAECRSLMADLKALPDFEETARVRLALGTVMIDLKETRQEFHCPICGTSQLRGRMACTMCGIAFVTPA